MLRPEAFDRERVGEVQAVELLGLTGQALPPLSFHSTWEILRSGIWRLAMPALTSS